MGIKWEGGAPPGYYEPSHMYTEDCQDTYRGFKWFNPMDWIFRASFSLKFESEMITWMENNCNGSWKLVGWV